MGPAVAYYVCHNLRGLGWLPLGPALSVVQGPLAYGTTGTLGQLLPWTLTVRGGGLAAGDRYRLLLNVQRPPPPVLWPFLICVVLSVCVVSLPPSPSRPGGLLPPSLGNGVAT